MKLGRDAVPALNKIKTVNNQEKAKADFLNYQIPDLTFMSKGQLRKEIDLIMIEQRKLLEYNLKLERELYQKQVEINNQKREIITLYDRLNNDKKYSALMIAG